MTNFNELLLKVLISIDRDIFPPFMLFHLSKRFDSIKRLSVALTIFFEPLSCARKNKDPSASNDWSDYQSGGKNRRYSMSVWRHRKSLAEPRTWHLECREEKPLYLLSLMQAWYYLFHYSTACHSATTWYCVWIQERT